MRSAFLLAVLTATMAAGAATAAAETEAPGGSRIVANGLRSEVTGMICGNVTVTAHVAASTCTIQARGVAHMLTHTIFGETTVARCRNTFEGAVNGNGHGYVGANQITFDATDVTNPVDCTGVDRVRPCTEADAVVADHDPDWEFQGYEDTTNTTYWLDIEICLAGTPVGATAGDLWVRVHTNVNGEVTGFATTHGTEPTGGHRIRNGEGAALSDGEFYGSWTIVPGGHTGVKIVD